MISYSGTTTINGAPHIIVGQPFEAQVVPSPGGTIKMGSSDTFNWAVPSDGAPIQSSGWQPSASQSIAPIPYTGSGQPVAQNPEYCYFTKNASKVTITCTYLDSFNNTPYAVSDSSLVVDAPAVSPNSDGAYIPFLNYTTNQANSNQTQIASGFQTLDVTVANGNPVSAKVDTKTPDTMALYGAVDAKTVPNPWGFYNQAAVTDPPNYPYGAVHGQWGWIQILTSSVWTIHADGSSLPTPSQIVLSTGIEPNPNVSPSGLDGKAFPYNNWTNADGTVNVMDDAPGYAKPGDFVTALTGIAQRYFTFVLDFEVSDYILYMPTVAYMTTPVTLPGGGVLNPIYVPIGQTVYEAHGGASYSYVASTWDGGYAGAAPIQVDSNNFNNLPIGCPTW
jgi:hypothetical protein